MGRVAGAGAIAADRRARPVPLPRAGECYGTAMDGKAAPERGDVVRPWPGILTRPRRAIRAAVDGRRWWPALLYVLVPVASWLLREATGTQREPRAEVPLTGDQQALVTVLVACLAPVALVILPWGFGRLLGGRGTLGEVFLAMIWAVLPATLLAFPIDVADVALHGGEDPAVGVDVFRPATLPALPFPTQVLVVLRWLVYAWTLVLQVVGLSEVHRFSKVRALVTLVVPLFLLGMLAAIAGALLVFAGSSGGA